MSSSSRHAVIIGGGVIGTACAYFPPPRPYRISRF